MHPNPSWLPHPNYEQLPAKIYLKAVVIGSNGKLKDEAETPPVHQRPHDRLGKCFLLFLPPALTRHTRRRKCSVYLCNMNQREEEVIGQGPVKL